MRRIRLGLPSQLAEPVLATRLAWLTGLRLALLTLLLALTGSFYLRSGFAPGSYSANVVLATLAVAYALAGVYAAVLRRGERLVALAHVQLVLDQLTWTALVYVSGGAASGATAFYGLTCLTGAIVIGLGGATVAALAGSAFYVALCAGFATGAVTPPPDQPLSSYLVRVQDMRYPVLLTLLVIMVVTLLAGYLAERLRLTGGRLAAATARAEQAERLAALGRLAAGLAHEIRNPLGSIVGSVQLLRDSEGLDAEARELCALVERETARLDDLVTDMLDLTRPRKPVLGAVDLAQAVHDVLALASKSGRGGDVALRYEGPHALPIEADAGQLRQLVWNLVRNAIQASSPGAEVVARVAEAGERATLEVHDDGPGISEDAVARIFDAFFTTRSSGMGIGLAVVKRIADDHGWTLCVESREGHGASFRVAMPRRKVAGAGTAGGKLAAAPA